MDEKSRKKEDLIVEGIASLGDKRYSSAKGLSELMHKKEEFAFIALNKIVIDKQVRSQIDINSESFKGLVESIREKGVLEPVLVRDDKTSYLLIAGERRYRACDVLKLPNIPARIFDGSIPKEDILSIQLIENIQREELSPIDEAYAYVEFYRGQSGSVGLEDIINSLILFERAKERLDSKVVATVTTLEKISGKSVSSLRNLLSLLKLPQNVQKAIYDNKIKTTHGYIFASKLNHSAFNDIFSNALKGVYTKDTLTQAFEKSPNTMKKRVEVTESYVKTLSRIRTNIQKNRGSLKDIEVEALIKETRRIMKILETEA